MVVGDRSEEIYAKVAAIPRHRRLVYDFLGLTPFALLMFGLFAITSRCKGDPVPAWLGALVFTTFLSCVGVVAALAWWLLSHPAPLRYLARFDRKTRPLILFPLFIFIFATAHHLLSPFVTRFDAEHQAYCDRKTKIREVFDDVDRLRLRQMQNPSRLAQPSIPPSSLHHGKT